MRRSVQRLGNRFFNVSLASEREQCECLLFDALVLPVRVEQSQSNVDDEDRRFLSLCSSPAWILDGLLHLASSTETLRTSFEQHPASDAATQRSGEFEPTQGDFPAE